MGYDGVYNKNTLATFNAMGIIGNNEANMSKISGMYFYAGVKTQRITKELISPVLVEKNSDGKYKGRATNVLAGPFPSKVTYANINVSELQYANYLTPRAPDGRKYYFNHELFYTPMDHIAYVPFLKFYYVKIKKDVLGVYKNNRNVELTLRQRGSMEVITPAKAAVPEYYRHVGSGNGNYNFVNYAGTLPYIYNGTYFVYTPEPSSFQKYTPGFAPAQGGHTSVCQKYQQHQKKEK